MELYQKRKVIAPGGVLCGRADSAEIHRPGLTIWIEIDFCSGFGRWRQSEATFLVCCPVNTLPRGKSTNSRSRIPGSRTFHVCCRQANGRCESGGLFRKTVIERVRGAAANRGG
jgi:hypothetical protein